MFIKIGTAGWSIPRDLASEFPAEGTALSRYAAFFPVVEINSSFHRPHRITTWERWRDSVPDEFRFSVKLPKLITHQKKLMDCIGDVDDFSAQIAALRQKLAVVLVQLPPKLAFEEEIAASFFVSLGERITSRIACEPRHPSWFTDEAEDLFVRLGVTRVAADPSICNSAAVPGGWPGLHYWRLHGSPMIYRSSYLDRIETYAAELQRATATAQEVWCIFDNTASSAGARDAMALVRATQPSAVRPEDSSQK